ncbi:hypothetical protein L1049_027305 [Liquidambar formosana]|uniref:Disease resistance protein At4g27190-like leucine-rich repeats domain-containing protein n=1 Tax=Liquidambar formosana TaxID=63359 RepID=A0AAP0N6W2_LIQFO
MICLRRVVRSALEREEVGEVGGEGSSVAAAAAVDRWLGLNRLDLEELPLERSVRGWGLGLRDLEQLIVEGCNSMEKIFELEGEGRTPISLSQLEYVELSDLPSLLMFCSGKYDFELPSLDTLHLEKCPKMHTFSSGLKGTPKLKTIEVKWYEEVWKGDLNSTIHDLFQEEVRTIIDAPKDIFFPKHTRT